MARPLDMRRTATSIVAVWLLGLCSAVLLIQLELLSVRPAQESSLLMSRRDDQMVALGITRDLFDNLARRADVQDKGGVLVVPAQQASESKVRRQQQLAKQVEILDETSSEEGGEGAASEAGSEEGGEEAGSEEGGEEEEASGEEEEGGEDEGSEGSAASEEGGEDEGSEEASGEEEEGGEDEGSEGSAASEEGGEDEDEEGEEGEEASPQDDEYARFVWREQRLHKDWGVNVDSWGFDLGKVGYSDRPNTAGAQLYCKRLLFLYLWYDASSFY
jgi:hypothetical protein